MPTDADQTEAQRELPQEVKDCEKSVREDNPDMDRSTAIAICQDLANRGKLGDGDVTAEDRLTSIQTLGLEADVPDPYLEDLRDAANQTEAAARTQPLWQLQGEDHDMDPPGPIRRSELEDGSIKYSNLLILAPGEWTDAATQQALFYSPELTRHIAEAPQERVVQNSLNLNHEGQDQLKNVGNIDEESVQVDRHGNLYADIVLWNDTTHSEDAVALMDRALESDGKQGAGGLSVEIPFEDSREEFDRDLGMNKLVEGNLAGVAIVTDGASEPANFDTQFQDRAIALMSPQATAGQTVNAGSRHEFTMEPITAVDDLRELAKSTDVELLQTPDGEEVYALADGDTVSIDIEGASIQEIRDALAGEPDEQREQQGDDEMAMVQNIIENAEAEGFDTSENTVADLMEFIQANMDLGEDEMAAMQDLADAFLEAVEADSLDAAPAEGLLDFIAERQNRTDDDMEDEEEADEELAAIKEENRELRDELDELRETVEAIADEPQDPRSLRETAEPPADDEDTEPSPAHAPVQTAGDYIGR